jgi:hypothetical protein
MSPTLNSDWFAAGNILTWDLRISFSLEQRDGLVQ